MTVTSSIFQEDSVKRQRGRAVRASVGLEIRSLQYVQASGPNR